MTRLRHCSNKRGIRLNWLAVSLTLCLSASAAQAELYEYRDESGRRIFVDRVSVVPLEYRDQLVTRDPVKLSADQREQALRLQEISRLKSELRQIDRLLNSAVSPIEFSNNQIIVPVDVDRGNRTLRLNLLLDTGANRTVFHRQALAPLGVADRPVGDARTASGEAIELYQAQLDRLQIGPFEIAPAAVQLLDFRGSAEHQGLLGMDLLSQVDYQLDLEGSRLLWAPGQIKYLESERHRLDERIQTLQRSTVTFQSSPER